jgi:hypothetical protein
MTDILAIFCGVFLASVYVLPRLHPSIWWAPAIVASLFVAFAWSLAVMAGRDVK